MPFRLIVLALVVVLPASAVAESYAFVAGDRVLVRAGRWDHAELRFEYWDGVSGEYQISPSGEIQMPLAGSVMAEGETANSLSTAISFQIQRRIGLTAPPEVAVEIAGHAPIYVGGSVAAPGSYPFRLGMTVQQAVALSGGIGSLTAADQNTDRELIRLGGHLRLLTEQIAALEAEETRLEAEVVAIETREADGLPPSDGEDIEGLERELFTARQESIETREANIQELQSVVSQQLARLDAQIELRKQQIELARADAEAMEELKDRGLSVRSRETAVLSGLANLEVQLSELEVARLNAEQQLNLAQRDEITLFDEARLGRLTALRNVGLDLADRRAEAQTARQLYAEATARGSVSDESDAVSYIGYVVTREVDGAFERISADPATRLAPGDTLDVTIELLPQSPSN
ncbi:MAG: polysaccharide biosynthesis/export family protein [Dinoroseobacter sp.]|nr:polysaccharide biosynthesis/export family protein [Dinoroseobacter sp.]